MDVDVPGFRATRFEALGAARTVYRRGAGPRVLVMHEIPGITPEVARFATRVADEGFAVAMPVLFGTPMRPFSTPYMLGQMARACVSREFAMLAKHRASPITEWLRALCRSLHEESGGSVGAIGMCITGNFALALMVDPWLMAPVLSQPSLPLDVGRAHREALHVAPDQLVAIKRRAAEGALCPPARARLRSAALPNALRANDALRTSGRSPSLGARARVLGMRFTHDRLCPPDRFQTLRRELGDAFEAIEIDSGPGNPHAIARAAHSVVTRDLIDEDGHPTQAALHRVLAFFREQLTTTARAASS